MKNMRVIRDFGHLLKTGQRVNTKIVDRNDKMVAVYSLNGSLILFMMAEDVKKFLA